MRMNSCLMMMALCQGSTHLPINKPFMVETNRMNDGISTISPFSFSSPSYRLYNGDITLEYATRQNPVPQLATSNVFQVDAKKHWHPSGLLVQRLQNYRLVVVDGTWKEFETVSDANGFTTIYNVMKGCHTVDGQCHSYLHHERRFPQQNWMKLMCCIGNSVTELQPSLKEKRYMPLEEGHIHDTCFPVGTETTFSASVDGELICFANDGYDLYWNNEGVLTVSLTKIL